MSSVQFDLDSDLRFFDSLASLGQPTADAIVAILKGMSDVVPWDDLRADYYWNELPISPADSYPGAHIYYRFIIALPTGEIIEIVALNYAPPVAVCVLARLLTG